MITRRMPQLATDSIVADFISQNHSDTAEAGIFAEWWKQRSISLGHMDIVRDYPEEAIILARWAEPGKDYKHWAGILYSFAGRCEKAISLGLQEKEIAANPECAP